ncbi:VWA domain-containing protein [Myxococcus sp. CA051A]|uniref:vWA domain-containing protein n=1 Tax=unclassified Myxococcus TaxID=2648731 RepID=UPI00157A8BC5|nr:MULTISPECIES: VWA domain-containing protein [unclassified Myxococcus]NTX10206.1 VWA domain-containing protein [Myxococcus sp. CA056]NTX37592.1 VWA domain-containing protein [Myxococcus sp. CA033]NTX67224.1 VWA domain-containing protein [Myxococcus sp. CA051A]
MKQTALAVERDAEHGREVLLLVTLEADADAPRAPVTANLVLDRSASMRGVPLLAAVQAAQSLVERASPRDYLGLLTFDAEPEQLLPVRAMDASAKAQFLKALSRLESGEGTALHEAIERGAEAVRRVLVPGARPQVLMLTDGEPSVGPSQLSDFKTLGARVVESGVVLHALGLGRHYLPDILEALTGPSGTGFVHVDDPEGLPLAVGTMSAELFGEVGSDARVYVLPSGFSELRCRHRYSSRVEGDAMSASLGAVSQSFPRRVLFSGRLDAAEWNLGVTTSYLEGTDTRRMPVPVARVLPDSDQGRFVRAVSAELELVAAEASAWKALGRRNQGAAEQALETADLALYKLARLGSLEVPPQRHMERLADLRRIVERRAAQPQALVMRRAHSEVSRVTLSRVGPALPLPALAPWKSED